MEKQVCIVPQNPVNQPLTSKELLVIKGGETETGAPPTIVTDDLADL